MDPTPQARGDVNHLTFGCPSIPITVQSQLERGPAKSEEIRWLQCLQEIQFPHLPSGGCPSLHWSNEGGSSGTYSRAGTRAL